MQNFQNNADIAGIKLSESQINVNRQNTFQKNKQDYYQRKSINFNIISKYAAENIKQSVSLIDKISKQWNLGENQKGNVQMEDKINIFNEGQINFPKILIFIKEKQEQLPEKKKIVNDKLLETLLNRNSLLSLAICCFLVEYLLQQDKTTKSIFDTMQSLACKYDLEIDWYKAYINFKPAFEEIGSNPYSQLTIHEKTFRSSLREIFQSLSRYHFDPVTRIPLKVKFSLNLLEEAIKQKARDFYNNQNKLLQVTQGESLHTFSYLIQPIKTFEKQNDISCCLNLYKFLDIQYIEKGLADNQKLPSWIQCINIINGVILISGIPEKKDIGSILFMVLDSQKYIVRSFKIQILQKQQDDPALNVQVFQSQSQVQPQKNIYLQKLQSNQESSLYNIQQKIRLKKASVFVKGINQSKKLIQNQLNITNPAIQINSENSPLFTYNYKNNFAMLTGQNTYPEEEREFEIETMRSSSQNIEERKMIPNQIFQKNDNIKNRKYLKCI
ncbi:hypothetical protein ABPG72_016508 [Tetrahymena utriculariae]